MSVQLSNKLCRPPIHRPRVQPLASSTFTPARLVAAFNGVAIKVKNDVTVGIISLGGGAKLSDTQAAFASWGLPVPHITDVSIGGATNSPGDPADAENDLDQQWVGGAYAALTGRPALIRMYYAPNTNGDFTAAVQQALNDGCKVLSISWGGPESDWGSSIPAFDAVLKACHDANVVVFVASGDNDSSDGLAGNNVDYPSSSPYAIGCGGITMLGTNPATWSVWNDGQGDGTGGGYSAVFQPLPSWQIGAPNGPGRMVPDMASLADPATGGEVWIDGVKQIIGGTSMAAPFLAGVYAAILGARLDAGLGPIIDFRSVIYRNPICFTDITQGNNGSYKAGPGVDPCTGLGVPNISALYNLALAQTPVPNPPPPVPPPTPTPPPIPTPIPTPPPPPVPPPLPPPVPTPVPPLPPAPPPNERVLTFDAATPIVVTGQYFGPDIVFALARSSTPIKSTLK